MRIGIPAIIFSLLCIWSAVVLPINNQEGGLQVCTPIFTYRVMHIYPHDPSAFTQGLVYDHPDTLIEGTGLYGQSTLRKVDLQTGTIIAMHEMSPHYFGEGVTVYEDTIIQLTYKKHTGFVYDRKTLTPVKTFSYDTEGWGITFDGTSLIMSDGSATLHFLNPLTFSEVKTLPVYDENGPVVLINELEYIDGEIYANIWLTDRIARISPHTGRVTAWIDLEGLLPENAQMRADVLNGIAYDARENRLFVTGKLWPYLFHIELIPPESSSPRLSPGPRTLIELII
jgi:glutamine cyclotransferase